MKPTKYLISPTTLRLFTECGHCFWLTLNRHWRRPDRPFPTLPSGFDRIAKTLYMQHAVNGTVPPELADEDVRLFEDMAQLRTWQDPWKGLTWQAAPNCVLRGAIDMVLRKEDALVVMDFKSRGYPPKEETIEQYRLSLSLYTLLLQQNGYAITDHAYLLFYVPNTMQDKGLVECAMTLTKVQIDLEEAYRVLAKALWLLEQEEPQTKCPHCRDVPRVDDPGGDSYD